MAAKWHKSEFKGVRFRKHPTRKHGIKFDRYFVITYKWQGKTVSEALGWASEDNKASEAYDILKELKHNQKTGEGPCTLAEKRQGAEIEKEAAAKARADKSRQTFINFFKSYYLPDAKTRCKPSTTIKSEQHVKIWINPVTGDTPMRDLGLAHVNRIKSNLAAAERTPRTMQYVFRTFSQVWNAAFDHGFVKVPCPTKNHSFRLPKVDNEKQRYLTFDEEKTLLKACMAHNQQVHSMALVSLDAGLRFGEIAALTWNCVDTGTKIIRVLDSKGRDRFVPMTARLVDLFKAMLPGESGALVFPGRNGAPHKEAPSPFRTAVVDAKLNENVTNKKMRASFHTLRHTYASRLVQAGVDLYRVQRLLGHSTPIMTARYSKLADHDLRRAVQTMEHSQAAAESGGKVISMKKAVK